MALPKPNPLLEPCCLSLSEETDVLSLQVNIKVSYIHNIKTHINIHTQPSAIRFHSWRWRESSSLTCLWKKCSILIQHIIQHFCPTYSLIHSELCASVCVSVGILKRISTYCKSPIGVTLLASNSKLTFINRVFNFKPPGISIIYTPKLGRRNCPFH